MGDADDAIKKSDWSLAETKITEAMRLEPANPTNVLLLSNLGMVQFNAGRDEDALTTLTNAHLMAPASVTVLQNRAHVYTALGRTDEAYSDYSRILSLDSTMVDSRFYRTMISLSRNDIKAAQTDIEMLKRIAADNRQTLLAEATLHIHTGHYTEAIPLLNRLIEKESDSALYGSRALCYLMTGQLGDASNDIAHGLEKSPTEGELYLYRALLNKMRYRQADAEADGRRAIELGIDPDRVHTLLK